MNFTPRFRSRNHFLKDLKQKTMETPKVES